MYRYKALIHFCNYRSNRHYEKWITFEVNDAKFDEIKKAISDTCADIDYWANFDIMQLEILDHAKYLNSYN